MAAGSASAALSEPPSARYEVGPAPTETIASAPAPADASVPGAEKPVVLRVRDLKTYFFTYDGIVRALDGVTFQVRRGETTGLVGETGCGKSVTAFSITRLIADPPGRVVSGEVRLDDVDLLWRLDQEAKFKRDPKSGRVRVKRSFRRIKEVTARMEAVRGRRIGMIFQEPSQAMNPIFTISDQVGESLLLHRGIEVVDSMLLATPNAPEVQAVVAKLVALPELSSMVAPGERSGLRAVCDELGRAAQSTSLGTELYYLLRGGNVAPEHVEREIATVLRRRLLSRGERRYLAHRRRLMVLRERLNEISISEMREGKRMAGAWRKIQVAARAERLTHFYYGLWGIRSRVQRPIKGELFWRVVKRLEGVSIANPVQVARGFPHELSGGMLQRVMIAMALAPEPDVLIADEPTTALDVTIQAQILELMRDLKERVGTAIVLITHDLAVIAEVADRVNVMYAGRIVESGPVRDLFRQPLHPYTQGLLASIPRLDRPEKELSSIPGSVPNLLNPPPGCRFHPRCPYAMPVCKGETPPMTVEGPGHQVACYLYKGPVATD